MEFDELGHGRAKGATDIVAHFLNIISIGKGTK